MLGLKIREEIPDEIVLDLKTCQKDTFGTIPGRVHDFEKSEHFPDMSSSKQHNFDMNEALGKKCTTISCAERAQESIGGV